MSKEIFITDDFLLEGRTAQKLYHDYAKGLPIIDYHCHLPPQQIADDIRFDNLTRIWLAGDHYKWRLMRASGVSERFCTGDANDREKFFAWAGTVPKIIGNPLYHWTHMELKRPFGISDRLLNPETAQSIWDDCNRKLQEKDFSSRGIMRQFDVKLVCTTDDPVDSLEHHIRIAGDKSFPVKVLPTFRPDKAMAIENPRIFNTWVGSLANSADMEISNWKDFMIAIRKRHDFFHENGCRISDHGLETVLWADYSDHEIELIFEKGRQGPAPSLEEIVKFKSAMMFEFGNMDFEKGWVQQLHLGALRNNNTRMFESLGPDTGFDSIGDFETARPLSRLLDRLSTNGTLPKTIVYNLNPKDNALLASMIGNFQDGTCAGKMQFGSAWWFLDHKPGMEEQLRTMANFGVLSGFIGMLTDSRSFLSYPRHDYFRRILCNYLGNEIDNGLIPKEIDLAGNIVQDICFRNASRYFGFNL